MNFLIKQKVPLTRKIFFRVSFNSEKVENLGSIRKNFFSELTELYCIYKLCKAEIKLSTLERMIQYLVNAMNIYIFTFYIEENPYKYQGIYIIF